MCVCVCRTQTIPTFRWRTSKGGGGGRACMAPSPPHPHRMHARTHARAHTRTHVHTHMHAQVLTLDSLGPSDAAGWASEAAAHTAGQQHQEAHWALSQGIKGAAAAGGSAESGLGTALLLNAAACHLKLGAPGGWGRRRMGKMHARCGSPPAFESIHGTLYLFALVLPLPVLHCVDLAPSVLTLCSVLRLGCLRGPTPSLPWCPSHAPALFWMRRILTVSVLHVDLTPSALTALHCTPPLPHVSAGPALALSCAALAVDPASAKGHYRAALALDELAACSSTSSLVQGSSTARGLAAAARWAMGESVRLGTGPKGKQAEAEALAQLRCGKGVVQQGGRGMEYEGAAGVADGGRQEMVRALAGLPATARSGSAAAAAGGEGGEPADTATAPAGAAAVSAAAAAKEAGNELFGAGKFAEALVQYQAGLAALSTAFAGLLASRAACGLHLGKDALLGALQDACAACAVSPALAEAHRAKVGALMGLGWLPLAEAACVQGPEVVPGDTELAGLRSRIAAAHAVGGAVRGAAGGSGSGPQASAQGSSRAGSSAVFLFFLFGFVFVWLLSGGRGAVRS